MMTTMRTNLIPLLKRCWIIAGPTGSGKSDLAMALARSLNGEIVAVDSMTVFRGLDIGTAKPSIADRNAIKHHLIDVLDPQESNDVASWLERCRDCLTSILAQGGTPILTGGSGLYWKAMLHGLPDHPPGNATIRLRLEEEANNLGTESLHDRLKTIDPVAALKIHLADRRRIIRGLEVWEMTGTPLSANRPDWSVVADIQPDSGFRWYWLSWPRPELHSRIEKRVRAMFNGGWIKEVQELEKSGGLGPQSSKALGYETIRLGLQTGTTEAKVLQRVTEETRQYAKQQETWLRSMPCIRPWPILESSLLPDEVMKMLSFET
jgi:tRNA dimethylallyltransferase